MLGLGLSITSVSGLRSLASKLLGILRSRSTYSENNVSSNAIIDAIDNVGVLDDATILLTPTAYSDARVHSVKTYTGDELVTNGTFDTDSDWLEIGGANINTTNKNVVFSDVTSGGVLQNNIFQVGHSYKVSFEITSVESGTGEVRLDAGGGTVISGKDEVGVYSATFTYASSAASDRVYIVSNSGTVNLTIDNVSVVDVSSDFDFDRASSATRINSDGLVQDMQSITDPELVLNGDFEELGDEISNDIGFDNPSNWALTGQSTVSNGKAHILQDDSSNTGITANTTIINKTYKITGVISDYVSGSVGFASLGSTTPRVAIPSQNGAFTIYYTSSRSTPSTWNIQRISSPCDLKIDNVSVQQVDPNDRWTVTDSDADNYVEFTEGFARLKFLNTSPVTNFKTSNSVLEGGKTYELVVDVHDVTSGSIKIDGNGISEIFDTEGITTRYITPISNAALSFYRASANVDITLASVSLKDITFSTDVDLARINYDSNGENGHWLLEPTSTNEITYSEDFSQTIWTKNDVLVEGGYTAPDGSNTAYKVTDNGGNAHLVGYYNINTGKRKSIWAKTVSGTGDVDLLNQRGNNLFTLTNEWQRFDATHAGAANFFYAVDFRDESTTLSEVIVWGAQLEALSYATSYIPTYGSTVTRAAETLTGSGNSTLINSTEGVLYVEALMQDTGAFKTAARITATDTSTTDGMWIYFKSDNKIQSVLRVGGVDQTGIQSGVKTTNQYYKVAFKFKQNDFALWIDGIEVATDSSGNTFSADTLSKVGFVLDTSINPFYGKVKALAVFDRALTDQELTDLTS